jgi:hypothetical protein
MLQAAALSLGCRWLDPRRARAWAVAGLGRPTQLVLTRTHAFVLETRGRGVAPASVLRLALDEDAPLARAVVTEPRGLRAFAVSGDTVFWATDAGDALCAARHTAPSEPHALATRPGGFTAVQAAPDGAVLALAHSDRSLLRITNARVATLDPGPVEAFTLDGDWVVFARGGRLWALHLGGGAPTPLCPVSGPVGALVRDGDGVFWSQVTSPRGGLTGSLHRVSRLGGAPTTLASGLHDPRTFAVAARRVWYAGAHITPEARFHVLGSVPRAGGSARYDESPVAIEHLVCADDRLYLLGVTRGPQLGVLRRRSA